jgi:hypothetical protein
VKSTVDRKIAQQHIESNRNHTDLELAYGNAHGQLCDVVENIQSRLWDCLPPDDPALNWGHVGDLHHALGHLNAVLAWMISGRIE